MASASVDLPPFLFDHMVPLTIGLSVDLALFALKALNTPVVILFDNIVCVPDKPGPSVLTTFSDMATKI